MTVLNNTPTIDAAQILFQRRTEGTQGERLPESCRPVTADQAWAIQNKVSALWCEMQDDSIGGWKCGMPSADKIVVAPIYTRTINSVSPVAILAKTASGGEVARIEPEFAFFLG